MEETERVNKKDFTLKCENKCVLFEINNFGTIIKVNISYLE